MSTPIRQNGLLDIKSPEFYAPRKLRESFHESPPTEPVAEANGVPGPQAPVESSPRYDQAPMIEARHQIPEPVVKVEHKASWSGFWRKPGVMLVGVAAAAGAAVGLVFLGAMIFTKEASTNNSEPPLAARLQSANAALDQVSKKAMVPMLAIAGTSGDINAPLPLGVEVTNHMPDASVNLSGLLAGAVISTGTASGEGKWRIPIDDLPRTLVIPPHNYVGPMIIAAELRNASDQTIVRSTIHLIWRQAAVDANKVDASKVDASKVDMNKVRASSPATVSPPAVEVTAALRQVEVTPTPKQIDPTVTRQVDVTAAPRQIDPKEAAALLRRAQELISDGDLSAARLLLQRLAEAHNARAAFELGATYDPLVTKKSIGAAPDPALAKIWYQKARDWGSSEASKNLEALASQNR